MVVAQFGERSVVWIQSSANFIYYQLFLKDGNKEKEVGMANFLEKSKNVFSQEFSFFWDIVKIEIHLGDPIAQILTCFKTV